MISVCVLLYNYNIITTRRTNNQFIHVTNKTVLNLIGIDYSIGYES